MEPDRNYPNRIEDFIQNQVISRGLDERTARAYRMDLERFYGWMEDAAGTEKATDGTETAIGITIKPEAEKNDAEKNDAVKNGAERPEAAGASEQGSDNEAGKLKHKAKEKVGWEDQMEAYLAYLSREKGLRYSTLYRKQRVFGYYLTYLVSQGVLERSRPLHPVPQPREASVDTLLTKKEVEAFFRAIDHEYEELDSDFRRRVCLRDQVMMELLFYHGLEISELLRLEVPDYNQKTATLTIRRKREKDRTEYIFSRALQRQMEEWLSEHVYFEHGGLYHNRMFLSKLGKPLSMKMVINIFDKYRIMAGIEKVCKPKDLKNSLGRYAEEVVREQG